MDFANPLSPLWNANIEGDWPGSYGRAQARRLKPTPRFRVRWMLLTNAGGYGRLPAPSRVPTGACGGWAADSVPVRPSAATILTPPSGSAPAPVPTFFDFPTLVHLARVSMFPSGRIMPATRSSPLVFSTPEQACEVYGRCRVVRGLLSLMTLPSLLRLFSTPLYTNNSILNPLEYRTAPHNDARPRPACKYMHQHYVFEYVIAGVGQPRARPAGSVSAAPTDVTLPSSTSPSRGYIPGPILPISVTSSPHHHLWINRPPLRAAHRPQAQRTQPNSTCYRIVPYRGRRPIPGTRYSGEPEHAGSLRMTALPVHVSSSQIHLLPGERCIRRSPLRVHRSPARVLARETLSGNPTKPSTVCALTRGAH
ncbi:hypothetical protein OBBRIDRAFT_891592 [Obba rivulosa]|uniref:Uncharacterized protein n=1 Tax=Obba rivulosa TaxID=1052685 RepID=A0A8E2AT47_9APHY|nr:hypothetical protein OBBRIDRAFT_891592 [Obba rivulosa]